MAKSIARAACASLLLSAAPIALTITLAGAFPAAAETWQQKTVRDLQSKAAAGDIDAQLELGNILIGGRLGMPSDPTEGLKLITKAANGGNTTAQVRLGQLHEDGKYVAKDIEQALSWYRRASAEGDARASVILARYYDEGEKVPRNAVQAVKWYESAAGQGDRASAFELGQRYDTGTGGALLDHVRAIAWYSAAGPEYERRADQAICINNTASGSSEEDNLRALPYCQKLEALGDVNGIYGMGLAYASGKGVAKDGPRAIDNLTRAANTGHRAAMTALGDIYLAGTLVPQDAVLALEWNRKAMRAGSRAGLLATARQYERGQGVAADLNAAARLYELALRMGRSPEADEWFKSHPQVSLEALRANVLTVKTLPRNVIFYDVPPQKTRDKTGKVIAETPLPPVDLFDYLGRLGHEVYPGRALDDEVEGSAGVECVITAEGTLNDCIHLYERPTGYGFAAAMDKVAGRLNQSRNKADWASQYAGKSISIGFGFRLR